MPNTDSQIEETTYLRMQIWLKSMPNWIIHAWQHPDDSKVFSYCKHGNRLPPISGALRSSKILQIIGLKPQLTWSRGTAEISKGTKQLTVHQIFTAKTWICLPISRQNSQTFQLANLPLESIRLARRASKSRQSIPRPQGSTYTHTHTHGSYRLQASD